MTVAFSERKMLPQDAQHIMSRMWEPGEAELERTGAKSHATAARFIKMADYGWTFFANGEMVAICGAQRAGDTYYTWFMATPQIAEIGREFTLWLRKFCKEAVEREGVNLEMYSASLHPNSDRWFSALGFVRGEADHGIYRHYKYARKNRLTALE